MCLARSTPCCSLIRITCVLLCQHNGLGTSNILHAQCILFAFLSFMENIDFMSGWEITFLCRPLGPGLIGCHVCSLRSTEQHTGCQVSFIHELQGDHATSIWFYWKFFVHLLGTDLLLLRSNFDDLFI